MDVSILFSIRFYKINLFLQNYCSFGKSSEKTSFLHSVRLSDDPFSRSIEGKIGQTTIARRGSSQSVVFCMQFHVYVHYGRILSPRFCYRFDNPSGIRRRETHLAQVSAVRPFVSEWKLYFRSPLQFSFGLPAVHGKMKNVQKLSGSGRNLSLFFTVGTSVQHPSRFSPILVTILLILGSFLTAFLGKP